MPCYSEMPTHFIRTDLVGSAAEALEMLFEQISENKLVITQGRHKLVLERYSAEQKFTVDRAESQGDFYGMLNVMKPQYAEETVKKFAQTNGYLITRTGKGQLQLVSAS